MTIYLVSSSKPFSVQVSGDEFATMIAISTANQKRLGLPAPFQTQEERDACFKVGDWDDDDHGDGDGDEHHNCNGPKPEAPHLSNLKAMDENGDGAISYDEWLSFFLKVNSSNLSQKLKKVTFQPHEV